MKSIEEVREYISNKMLLQEDWYNHLIADKKTSSIEFKCAGEMIDAYFVILKFIDSSDVSFKNEVK